MAQVPPLATPMVVVGAISRYLHLLGKHINSDCWAYMDIIMLKIVIINWNLVSSEIKYTAISARSAICFLQPILQVSKRSSRPTLRLRFLYCICTLLMYTNTARWIEAEQILCSEAMTSDEVGLLQNFRVYKKWIPFSFNFWAIISHMQLINVNASLSPPLKNVWIFDNP